MNLMDALGVIALVVFTLLLLFLIKHLDPLEKALPPAQLPQDTLKAQTKDPSPLSFPQLDPPASHLTPQNTSPWSWIKDEIPQTQIIGGATVPSFPKPHRRIYLQGDKFVVSDQTYAEIVKREKT